MKKLIYVLPVIVLLFLTSCTASQSGSTTQSSDAVPADIHITKLTVNGEEITLPYELSLTDNFVCNLSDTSSDKLIIDAQVDVSGAEITYDDDISGFVQGENKVMITLSAPDNIQKQFTLIIGKYDDNGLTANHAYNRAEALYWFDSSYFDFDYNKTVQPDGKNELSLITDYQDVLTANFTKSGMRQFEEYNDTCIYNDNGTVYGEQPQCGSDITYLGTVLIQKSVDENTITYTARSYYIGESAEDCTVAKNEFSLIKQDGVWLIDSFVLPD